MIKKNSHLLAMPDQTEIHPQAKLINPVSDHKHLIRKPTQVWEHFAHLWEEFVHVREEQTHLWEEQTHVWERLAHLWEKPTHLRQRLAHLWEVFAHLRGQQTHLRQEFTHLQPGNFPLHMFDIDVNNSQIPMRIRIK